jgi:hypothetical protein
MSWFSKIVGQSLLLEAPKASVKETTKELPKGAGLGAEEPAPRFYGLEHPFQTASPFGGLSSAFGQQIDLQNRYADYEAMSEYPVLSTALDIYADDSTKKDHLQNRKVWCVSEHEGIQKELNDLLDRLKIGDDLRSTARLLCLYGNRFSEIAYSQEGVAGFRPLPTSSMRRVETDLGKHLGFAQLLSSRTLSLEAYVQASVLYQEIKKKPIPEPNSKDIRSMLLFHQKLQEQLRATGLVPFEPWEVIHWRLRESSSVYGYGILHDAIWAWRRLTLLEDSAIVYKLTRSPARFVFYIDTTSKTTQQAQAHIQNAKTMLTKKRFVTPDGKIDFRASPLGQEENFFVATSNGKRSTEIEMLSGADWQNTEDLEYFLKHVLAKLKIPRAYLSLEEGDTRASLAQLDSRFASTVERIQNEILAGVSMICRYHLTAKGIDPDAVKWSIHMTPPSQINELAQIEALSAKADLASRMVDFFPKDDILRRAFGLSEQEAREVTKAKEKADRAAAAMQAELEASAQGQIMAAQQAAMPEEPQESVLDPMIKKILTERDPLDASTSSTLLREIRRLGADEKAERLRRDQERARLLKLERELIQLRKEIRRTKILTGIRNEQDRRSRRREE